MHTADMFHINISTIPVMSRSDYMYMNSLFYWEAEALAVAGPLGERVAKQGTTGTFRNHVCGD